MSERIEEAQMGNDHPPFDARAVLAQARSGNVPAAWHVYHASRFYNILMTVLIVIMALTSGPGLIFSPWMRMLSSGDLELIISAVTGLAVSLICFPSAVAILVLGMRELRAGDRQLLVVTPDGFVERCGRYSTLTVSFSDPRYTPLRSTYGARDKRALLLPDERGQLIEWHPDPRFRPAGQIVEQILAAYAAYTTERAHEQ